jgi:glycosyltransferase involved in cell wall biosynthesis
VTVFNSCGPEVVEADGVTFKPWWMYSPRDKYDVVIMWRSPRLCDHDLNAGKILIDLHDVIQPAEFTAKRLAKMHKIMVKSQAHRILFPNIPDAKFEIVQNGMDVNMFTDKVEKDQYLMINTSSPDRSMDVLPKLFKKIKEQVPEARLQWAYGWDIWDIAFKGDKKRMAYKDALIEEIKASGIEIVGRLPQHEVAKMYQRANILAYPTEFYEIDCISVRKAQLAGCLPISTDFAALAETNAHGIKIPSKKDTTNWSLPYQMTFGLTDEKAQEAWVKSCVDALRTPISDRTNMVEWAKQYSWDIISNRWLTIIQ